jgi:FkbM family methyltransferase
MTTLERKVRTARRHLQQGGVQAVTSLTIDVTRRWLRRWHRFAEIDNCRFSLAGLPDSMIELLLSGKYELAERTLLKRSLDCNLPVVELGGCIGVLACIINRRLANPARHIVVEANPNLGPILVANRRRNGCNFTIVPKAIAYGTTSVSFSADEEFLVNRVLENAGSVTVEATNLGTILKENAITHCTLICDIEGTEYSLVAHEADVLASCVRHLVFEAHPKILGIAKVDEILVRLQAAGFVLVDRTGDSYALVNSSLQINRTDINIAV